MILTTTETVPGRQVTEILGVVRGGTTRARHVGRDIMAQLKNVVGGEVANYTKLMAEAREQAMDRLRASAAKEGADAVIGVRFFTTMLSQGMAEICAYGTAVKLA